MSDDVFDEDGYPTDETLDRIKAWPWQDALECLYFVKDCWHWSQYAEEIPAGEGAIFRFATGGWSGNESLIAALNSNVMIRFLTWRMSQSGGLHIYHFVPMWGKE